MRKPIALLLAPALLVQACASAPPPSPQSPPTLADVNPALEDQPAMSLLGPAVHGVSWARSERARRPMPPTRRTSIRRVLKRLVGWK